MTVQERIRMSLILEKMRKNRATAERLGLKDISKIADNTSGKEQAGIYDEGR